MGYLLATFGIVILLAIIAVVAIPRMGGRTSGDHNDAAGPENPHREKEQMDEPQEEFVDDAPASSPPPSERPETKKELY
jgi:hypothetical protein